MTVLLNLFLLTLLVTSSVVEARRSDRRPRRRQNDAPGKNQDHDVTSCYVLILKLLPFYTIIQVGTFIFWWKA